MKEKGPKKGGEILSEGKSQTESGKKRTNASMSPKRRRKKIVKQSQNCTSNVQTRPILGVAKNPDSTRKKSMCQKSTSLAP